MRSFGDLNLDVSSFKIGPFFGFFWIFLIPFLTVEYRFMMSLNVEMKSSTNDVEVEKPLFGITSTLDRDDDSSDTVRSFELRFLNAFSTFQVSKLALFLDFFSDFFDPFSHRRLSFYDEFERGNEK